MLAARECISEHLLARVLDARAAGETSRESRNSHARHISQRILQEERGAIAFERGVETQNDFFDRDGARILAWVLRAFEQTRDGEISWADAFERAQAAVQYVIEPFEHACLFECDEVLWLLDDHHDRSITRCVVADGAGRIICKIPAHFARADGALHFSQCMRELLRDGSFAAEHVQRESLGCSATNAWQASKLFDERLDDARICKPARELSIAWWLGTWRLGHESMQRSEREAEWASVNEWLGVLIDDRCINFWVQACVHGAFVTDLFNAGAHVWGHFARRNAHNHGQLPKTPWRWGRRHVLLDVGGCTGDVEVVALGPHRDGGKDAAGECRGDKIGRAEGCCFAADVFGCVGAELRALGVNEVALFVANVCDGDLNHGRG